MLENKKAKNTGIHYSRYIASWERVGGFRVYDERFEEWLRLEGLTDDEIQDVREMATMGKMELEKSADEFIRRKHNEAVEKRAKEEKERKKKVRLEVMKRIAKFARK